MNESVTRYDVRISGAGAVAGGTYRNVSIDGSASLTGDIDCLKLKVNGAADGHGSMTAESMVVNGSLSYRGDAKAGDVRVSGTATFGGLSAEMLSVAGTLEVKSLRTTQAKIAGYFRSAGDCEAERFHSEGGFAIGGLLNAGVVEIVVWSPCSVGDIGGEAVSVTEYGGSVRRLMAKLVSSLEGRLTADTIEGDDVRLEQTTAKAVRGNTVVIGKGCRIDLVEYTGECTVAPGAKVKEQRKVGGDMGA